MVQGWLVGFHNPHSPATGTFYFHRSTFLGDKISEWPLHCCTRSKSCNPQDLPEIPPLHRRFPGNLESLFSIWIGKLENSSFALLTWVISKGQANAQAQKGDSKERFVHIETPILNCY